MLFGYASDASDSDKQTVPWRQGARLRTNKYDLNRGVIQSGWSVEIFCPNSPTEHRGVPALSLMERDDTFAVGKQNEYVKTGFTQRLFTKLD